MVGTRAAHVLEFFPLVQSGKTLSTDLIETEGSPLVAGPVVTRKENEGVLEISTLFEQ